MRRTRSGTTSINSEQTGGATSKPRHCHLNDKEMTAEEIQAKAGRLREERGLSKYRVAQDGVFSSVNAVTRFETGVQTARFKSVERYLDYLGYKLEIVPK